MHNNLNDLLASSLDGIKTFTDFKTAVNSAITTPSGVTIIPVSKINMGLLNGGVDLPQKRSEYKNFAGGGGTGISVTPVAFLTVSSSGEINLISLKETDDGISRIVDLIEESPEIIGKIKNKLKEERK